MKQLVYDLPMRLFHWLFAGLFLFAFLIAKNIDDESITFIYHMRAGLSIGFIVILRLVWGFIGTKQSKFVDFDLNPMNLLSYMKGILTGDKQRWAGHNPASSWAGIIMMFLGLGLAVTGYLMTSGDKEAFEDIHEIFANTFLIVIIMHVVGIIVHTIRHKEMIGLSMITGQKEGIASSDVINSSRWQVGILFLALFLSFNFYISKNLNLETKTLTFFGKTLQLGEHEGHEHGNATESHDSDND